VELFISVLEPETSIRQDVGVPAIKRVHAIQHCCHSSICQGQTIKLSLWKLDVEQKIGVEIANMGSSRRPLLTGHVTAKLWTKNRF